MKHRWGLRHAGYASDHLRAHKLALYVFLKLDRPAHLRAYRNSQSAKF